jgi:DNA polymerase-3 subunit gamma/tau
MSYIVLARKWRPQTFDDLIGQETVVRTIQNALSSKKIVHAYLFSGPRGIGKTSAARILAKALNCSQEPAMKPCGTCQNCIAIADSASVDVLEIDGASNTGVDDVRELRESVKYAPSSSRYKIYIIDEVHMLSIPAFNALLKTLEEPPPHVIFIFATTEPRKVPVTILSRCQHHSLRKIPKVKIKERIMTISRTEGINIQDTAVEMIARAADGSMRDALTILDQASSFSTDISEKDLQTLLGLPEAEIIITLSDTILSGDVSRTLTIIKELTERGYDLRPVMRELVEHFRNIAVVKVVESPDEFLEFTEEEIKTLNDQASQVNLEELTLLLTELLKLEAEVRSTVNPRYALELGILRTSFIKGMPSIQGILKKLDEGEDSSPPGPYEPKDLSVTTKQKVRGSQDTPGIQDKQKLWQETIKRLKQTDNLLAYKLAEAKLISISDTEITAGFNGGLSVFNDSIKKNASLIENMIREISGNTLRLKIISLPGEKKNSAKLKDEVLLNPLIKSALELFNGKLVL